MEYPLQNILPAQYVPDFLKDGLSKIVVTSQGVSFTEFTGGMTIELGISYRNNGQDLRLPLFTEEGLIVVIHELAMMRFSLTGQSEFKLNFGTFSIELPSFLKPVDANGNIVAGQKQTITLSNNNLLSILWQPQNGILIKTIAGEPVTMSIGNTMIADTGIIFKATEVAVDVVPPDYSIAIKHGFISLPKDLINLPDIELNTCSINSKGFSGSVKLDWDLSYDVATRSYKMNDQQVKLFGEFTGGLDSVELTFENNIIKACNITGELLIPYFDSDANERVRIGVTINDKGELSIVAKSDDPNGITLTKDQLLQLHVQSLEILNDNGTRSFSISGGLEPMLYSAEGMKWPRMDVKDLRIGLDQQNKPVISIEEAWLDLKDLATLDLFGFHLELRRIGFGTLDEGGEKKLWLDLSGGLKLVDQIPIGLDIEGFRIIWPQDLSIPNPVTAAALSNMASSVGIQFKGVQFSFGVPNALKIDGLIRFFKDAQSVGFAGDMVLDIPPAGIKAEAGLLVGMNTSPNPYAFFYVYFGLECTAGIPLGQSGLALKGAMGLFGINVTPDKSPEQNWYYDWYKRAPAPGAHQTTKWRDQRDSLAIGAGVTITTVDGIVKGTKGIVVLALPGPILVINGKALILDGLNPGEPPFTATAVFDGREKIVQFNLEAQAEIVKDMVDAYAGVEAFFDFKDVTNWHLYLGQDRPEDRRIRANILNIIEADAYLMLDMIDADSPRARMGVTAKTKPKIPDVCFDIPLAGEKCITFKAHVDLGGNGQTSMQPEQFSGGAFIDAGIEINALGIEVEIGAEASLEVEGPAPFSLQADLDLYARLPDPLPDYEDEFHYELEIPKVDLQIADPLMGVSLFNRFTSESKNAAIHNSKPANSICNNASLESSYLTGQTNGIPNLPVVNCDSNPVLSFGHEMNQDYEFIMHPGGTKRYDVGIIRITPKVKRIVIQEKKKSAPSSGWITIYSTDNDSLSGVWLAESDPGSPERPASRRLQLLTTNPLINTTHTNGTEGFVMLQTDVETNHLSALILNDYPELMLVCPPNPSAACFNFLYGGKAIQGKAITWADFRFENAKAIIISDGCLQSETGLKIIFPEPLSEIEIIFCNKPENVSVTAPCNNIGDITVGKKSDGIKITSNASLDCVRITATNKDGLQIKLICYLEAKVIEDAKVNKSICDTNRKKLGDEQDGPANIASPVIAANLFNPGCFYKVIVESESVAQVRNIKEDFIRDLYRNALGDTTRTFATCSYFQTESPPENIDSYIKWSMPFHQAADVFTNDPWMFRFNREYIKALFANGSLSDYKLRFFLKDINNNTGEYPTNWDQQADSYTLFPDEETWQSHLQGSVGASAKKDNLLRVAANGSAVQYKPNGRYELMLAMKAGSAAGGTLIEVNNVSYKVLNTIAFTTAKYASFGDCISTASIKAETLKGKAVLASQSEFDNLVSTWVNAEVDLYKTTVDYRYGMARAGILVGKEALEKTRQQLKEARAAVDDKFTSIAMNSNSDLQFRDMGEKAEMFVIDISQTATKKLSCFWVRLPQSIELMRSSSVAGRKYGKVSLSLFRNDTKLTCSIIFNADSSQFIIRPADTIIAGNYTLQFTWVRDFKDDQNIKIFGSIGNAHHRYDRPSIKGAADEVYKMKFFV